MTTERLSAAWLWAPSPRNAPWLRCGGLGFRGKIPPKNASCWSRLWRNTNRIGKQLDTVYFSHSFITWKFASFSWSFVSFWWKKNDILTSKIEILKHADFASEWRKSRFRRLEILQCVAWGCKKRWWELAIKSIHGCRTAQVIWLIFCFYPIYACAVLKEKLLLQPLKKINKSNVR